MRVVPMVTGWLCVPWRSSSSRTISFTLGSLVKGGRLVPGLREPPRSPESSAANSPTRRRGIDAKDAEPPLPDIATELSSVYFSYSPDPAALDEEDAAVVAEQQAEQEMERARLQEALGAVGAAAKACRGKSRAPLPRAVCESAAGTAPQGLGRARRPRLRGLAALRRAGGRRGGARLARGAPARAACLRPHAAPPPVGEPPKGLAPDPRVLPCSARAGLARSGVGDSSRCAPVRSAIINASHYSSRHQY